MFRNLRYLKKGCGHELVVESMFTAKNETSEKGLVEDR